MNPLNIKVNDDYITFPLEPELVGKTFQCSSIQNYKSNEDNIQKDVIRYRLFDTTTKNEIIIETVMESGNDFNIRYYENVDNIPFDWDFANIIGTSPFGFNNPKYPNIDHLVYDKIKQGGEEWEEVAIYPSKKERKAMSKDEKKNLYKDDDGDKYFLVDRSLGARREIDGKEYFAWIYDRKPEVGNYPIYLLIEVIAFETSEEYDNKKPNIVVYEGKKLLINDIKVN